jgi:hypothetical protein
MGESSSIPAQVVVAKRNKDKLASIGVTEEKVFLTLKRAMNACKPAPPARGRRAEPPTEITRSPKRDPDWNIRLRAIELYVTLTCISPEDVSKSLKGVTIDMTPHEAIGDALPSTGVIDALRAQGRSAVEIARAMANGSLPSVELPEGESLPIPPKTRLSVKELLDIRKEEIQERMGDRPPTGNFTPSSSIRPEDL